MTFQLPPIAKTAERLLAEITKAVSRFPREYRYEIGKELRNEALEITTMVHRAWRDQKRRVALISKVKWSVDTLKIRLQLCSRVCAFASLAQYEALARIARELGRQAGGWLSSLSGEHPNGQNAQGGNARAQRAKKLSTRDASQWEVYQ